MNLQNEMEEDSSRRTYLLLDFEDRGIALDGVGCECGCRRDWARGGLAYSVGSDIGKSG